MKKLQKKEMTMKEKIARMRENPLFVERMKFTKEQFFPAMVAASNNVEDAQMFLGSMSSIIMEKFLQSMKDKTLGELKLVESLDKKDKHYEQYCDLLALFDNKTIFESKEHFENMKNEIALFINREMGERKLDSLKTSWLDELQNLLAKYPQVDTITYTIRETKTVTRGVVGNANIDNQAGRKEAMATDEGALLDKVAAARLETIKQMTKYD
jgi:hypothetical protein